MANINTTENLTTANTKAFNWIPANKYWQQEKRTVITPHKKKGKKKETSSNKIINIFCNRQQQQT